MEDTTLGKKTGKVASLAKAGKAVRMGMAFVRHFSVEGTNPLDAVKFVRRRSEISEPNGKVVFEMDDVEVPESWTQLATDIVVSKYFRKAGVPRIERETSVEQVIYRIAHSIRVAGEDSGYFNTPGDAEVFEDELTLLLW